MSVLADSVDHITGNGAQGGAELVVNSALGSWTIRVWAAAGVNGEGLNSIGDWHYGIGPVPTLNYSITGNGPAGEWYAFLVQDNVDVGGNYSTNFGGNTVSGFYFTDNDINLRAGSGTLDGLSTYPGGGVLEESGPWRLVITTGNDASSAADLSSVNSGGASGDWHYDSDGNGVRGGVAAATGSGNKRLAVFGTVVEVEELTSSIDSTQKYGDTPNISVRLRPRGGTPNDFRGESQVKAAIDVAPYDQQAQVERFVSISTSGVGTSSTYNVNTVFSQTPEDHILRVGVNTAFDSTSPSGQIPGLLSGSHGSVLIPSTERSSFRFATSGHAAGFTGVNRDEVRRDAVISVGSGIQIDSVESHDDAGRVNASKLFRRAWDGSHERPYLKARILDAFGSPLINTDVTARVRITGTSTNEDSQNLTTDANGDITWDYQIATSHQAYNRFKSGGDTSTLTVEEADVFNSNPYPLVAANFDYTGPYSSKGKDVNVLGREYGSLEPEDTLSGVFGVVSEITTPNIWTGDAGQATDDANNAPIGVVGRFKNLGTGSPRGKPSSEIDEGNAVLVDPARPVSRDSAGRPIDADPRLEVRYAAYNVTLGSETIAETNAQAQEDMTMPLGYPVQYVTLPPPGDPSVVRYAWAFATTPAQRDSFTQTSDTVAGFSSDSGMYGYTVQNINFTAVDPNLTFTVVTSTSLTHPQDTITINSEIRRILGTNVRVPVIPDAALKIYIDKMDETGNIESVIDDVMTPVSGSDSQFEYDFTPGLGSSYSVTVTGFTNGSRPPNTGEAIIFTGAQNPAYGLVVDAVKSNTSDSGNHILPQEPFKIVSYMVDESDGSLVSMDAGLCEVALVRSKSSGVVETYDETSGGWLEVTGAQKAKFYQMTDVGPTSQHEFTLPDGDFRDVVATVRCKVDGVSYTSGVFREITSPDLQHDSEPSQNIGITTEVIDPEDSSVVQSHLRSGYAAKFTSTPKTSVGVDPSAVNYQTQWSIRRTSDSGTFDWDGTQWVAAGASIELVAPSTVLGDGTTEITITESGVQAAIDDGSSSMDVSALVTYDAGTIRERLALETVQVELFTNVNSHDKYGFDPLSVVGFGSR